MNIDWIEVSKIFLEGAIQAIVSVAIVFLTIRLTKKQEREQFEKQSDLAAYHAALGEHQFLSEQLAELRRKTPLSMTDTAYVGSIERRRREVSTVIIMLRDKLNLAYPEPKESPPPTEDE